MRGIPNQDKTLLVPGGYRLAVEELPELDVGGFAAVVSAYISCFGRWTEESVSQLTHTYTQQRDRDGSFDILQAGLISLLRHPTLRDNQSASRTPT